MFLIHAPKPYTHRSGGVRALYRLGAELLDRGFRVGMMGMGSPRRHDVAPFELENGDSWSPDVKGDAVHVFPEIVATKELQFPKCVRWLLNHERHTPRKDELQFVWTPDLKPGVQRLTVDIIERDVFYPKSVEGDGVVWYGGKGARLARDVPAGAVQITNGWPEDRNEMGDLLRSAIRLISFDGFSSLNVEATLCGTPVLIPDVANARRVTDPLFRGFGLAFGEGEWEWAVETVGLAFDDYEQSRCKMGELVDRFVDSCEFRFGGLV